MLKKLRKGLSFLLVFCMVLSMFPVGVLAADDGDLPEVTAEEAAAAAQEASDELESLTMGTKPADGTTTGNPFVQGTGGSNSFRIPAMVTLNNGTLVAAADARWNTTYDGGGLDTIVSYSTNNGDNWNYTFANYLGDNGNTYNGSGSTAFIDPALATDGSTVYMLCDLYPYGVALNGSGNTAPSTAVGFTDDGYLKLAKSGSSGYTYYLKDGQIYNSSNNVVSGYTVDAYFNITGTDGTSTNLFFSDSPYQVVRTGYLYLTSSIDGGKTWSEPTLIPNVKTTSEQVCLVGPGRGLVTSDKKIVFPVYSYNGSSTSQQMGFIYSSDGGETWARSANFTGASWSSEAAVVELDDGTLRFFYRNGTSKLYYVDYHTSTSSWDTAVSTGIATNSNTQISAITLQKTVDGKQVILVSCPTGSNSNGSADSSASARLNGKIFVGLLNSDNTIAWQSDKAISVTSNNSQFMYSCMTALTDSEGNETGEIAILYENNESAWGTGDNCYYTMDFQTYDLGLTFDEETNDNIFVDGDDNGTGITINFGSNKYTSVTVTAVEPEVLSGKTYVAYDITVPDFSGEAKVTIPLNDAFAGKDTSKLQAVYINDAGKIADTIEGTYDAEVDAFTFTATHFSTYAVTLAETGTETETTKDVTLTVGGTAEYTVTGNNYQNDYTPPNTSVAKMDVKGTDAQEGSVEYTEASVSCNDLISSNQSDWTAVSDYYYTPDGSNFYPVYAKRSSSNYRYTYTWGYSTTESSSSVTPIGSEQTVYSWNISSTAPSIKVYTKSEVAGIPASTTITFTGVSAGETTAVVGPTTYNIKVNRKTETVNLSVGSTATYADASTGTPVVADSTIASASLSNGTLIITGLKDGKTTVTTGTTDYTVTVSDGTPISIKENETTTISVELSTGQTVEWSSADNNYVGVAGKYDTTAGAYTNEAILAGQNVTNTDSPVVVTATIKNADGTVAGTQKWLVTVTEGDGDTNTSSKGIYFNIDTIEHCTVYYSINGGELIPVNGTGVDTGVWTENGTYTGHFNIMFFAKPDEGYALTYMSISGSADQYYTLANGNPDGTGSDAWPFNDAGATTIPSSSGDSAWKTINGSLHGFRWALLEGNMTIDQMKVMFSNAIALGCDGATTITKNGTDGMGSASSPTVCKFVAQKLPTLEKTIKSITRDGTELPYTDGMTVKIGDTINYSVVVTRYATNATYGTITYSNESLTDELTENNGIDNPTLGTSTTSDRTYTYTTSLTLTKENFANVVKKGTITNTAEFSCKYSSQYSAGSLDTKASAVAEVTVEIPKYVVDFGLPLEIDLTGSTSGAGSITKVENGTYGTAKVNADGTGFTYTPTTTLKGVDYVTFTYRLKDSTTDYQYTVSIYPATTVYYEEGFATYTGSWAGNTTVNYTATQAAQIAGSSSDEYGYDDAYKTLVSSTNGTEAVSPQNSNDLAAFTFTGTGVDIYANCTTTTGMVMVVLKKVNEDNTLSRVKLLTVDTKMANGDKEYTQGQYTNGYNIPIVSLTDLPYGNYQVSVTHVRAGSDETNRGSGVRLDGFRVYGTLNDSTLHASGGVYFADGEDNPIFLDMRDEVLTAKSVAGLDNGYATRVAAQVYSASDLTGNGAIILSDDNDKLSDDVLLDYLKNGPKNEIYLLPGQALVFNITTKREVQIGLKALNASTTCTINGTVKTITTNTDMFYTVLQSTDTASKQTITITNTGNYILSITKLKICDDPDAALGQLTEDDLVDALVSLGFEKSAATRFDDISEDSWYYDAVEFVTDRGYFVGVADNLFGPEQTMTRGMFVTVLGRAAKVDAAAYADVVTGFTDVDSEEYYAPYVAWARENGIVYGKTDTEFCPDMTVTREEMAAFMCRFAKYLGLDVAVEDSDWMDRYTDAEAISSYARDAIGWCVSNGIMTGTSSTTISPSEVATRAQVATVITNLVQKVIERK